MHIGTRRTNRIPGEAMTKTEQVKVLATMEPEDLVAKIRQPELRFLDRARFFPWEPKGK